MANTNIILHRPLNKTFKYRVPSRRWVITGDKSPQCFVTSQLSRTSRPELSDLNWWQLYWVDKRRRRGLTDLPPNSCRPDSIGILYVELHGGDHDSQIPPNRGAATITHTKPSLYTIYDCRVCIHPSVDKPGTENEWIFNRFFHLFCWGALQITHNPKTFEIRRTRLYTWVDKADKSHPQNSQKRLCKEKKK